MGWKKILVAATCCVYVASAAADGLGISSKTYADRFNNWAEEFQSPMRLRSEGAKVTKGPKVTTVRLNVDRFTSVLFSYGADATKLNGVTLFRELGGDMNQSLDAMTSMMMASMSAFEAPKAAKVPDLTVKVCGDALKKPDTSYEQKVQGRTVNCMVTNGVAVLSVY